MVGFHLIASHRIVSHRSAAHHNIPSTVPGDSTHTTPHHSPARPVPYSTTPLAPRSQTPCRRDGRTDRRQRPKQEPRLFRTHDEPTCCAKSHATPPHDTPLLFFSTTEPSAGNHSVGAQNGSTACHSHHITSHQPITQPTNLISNVSIVIFHQLIPPLLYILFAHSVYVM
jgi:hypothetical protein